jgi:heat shock protein HslJ
MSITPRTLGCDVTMNISRAVRPTVFARGGSIVALALATACTPAAPASPTTPPAPPTTAAVTSASPAASAKPSPSPASSPAASPAAAVKPAPSPSASPAVASALASPSAGARTANSGLLGAWQWQSTQSTDGPALVAERPAFSAHLQPAGVLQIRADCNQVGGTYTTSGNDLTIKLGPSTLVACPQDSQAQAFLASLEQVTTYTANGTNLELGLQRGGRMLFAVLPPQSLVGPDWQLTGYNNGRGAVQSVVIGTLADARFGADGQVTASAGCNRHFGPFQSTDRTLTIGPLWPPRAWRATSQSGGGNRLPEGPARDDLSLSEKRSPGACRTQAEQPGDLCIQ